MGAAGRGALLSIVAAGVIAGCFTVESDAPLPEPTPEETGSPSPTPPVIDVGDGHHGSISIALPEVTVNLCRPLLAATTTTSLALSDATGFQGGDRVLLHQVQVQAGTFTSGDASPVAGSDAGRWELARITNVSGSTITVAAPLRNGYSSAGSSRAQVCSVPEFTDVRIAAGSTVRCAPWDGSSGGIVALMASGALTIEDGASVRCDAGGFRGGVTVGDFGTPSNCCQTELDATQFAAGKGEGFDAASFSLRGRGNRGNGGGGGNRWASGGGGGSGAGDGGSGAGESTGCFCNPNGGMPGARVIGLIADRLAFGGGGGGGHGGDAPAQPTSGGPGGGVVVLIANHLEGSGRIDVSGGSAADASAQPDSGGGGGGGGGTALVRAITSDFEGPVFAVGGAGGNSGSTDDGPGGGGGGGHVKNDRGALDGSTIVVDGGMSGVDTGGDPHEAGGGSSGVVEL